MKIWNRLRDALHDWSSSKPDVAKPPRTGDDHLALARESLADLLTDTRVPASVREALADDYSEVEAFLDTARRDLFFVPIAITYERLVEESSMVDELEGGAKTEESVLGLVRARKYLQRRFGSWLGPL